MNKPNNDDARLSVHRIVLLYPMNILFRDDVTVTCAPMSADSILAMVNHYKHTEFSDLINEAMELAFYDDALVESDDDYEAKFIPQSQVS